MTKFSELNPPSCTKLSAKCVDGNVSIGYDEEFPTYLRLDSPWNWCSLNMKPIVDACLGVTPSPDDPEKPSTDHELLLQLLARVTALEQKVQQLAEIQVTTYDIGEGQPLEENHFVAVVNN